MRPTGGAEVVRPDHVVQGLFLSGQTVIYLPGEAAGELRPVEAVFMALEGRLVLLDAPFQIQACANKGSVIGIPQGVMGRAAGGDLEKRQGGLQGFLGAGTVCLGVEHHLGVVPTAGPVCRQLRMVLRTHLLFLESAMVYPRIKRSALNCKVRK